MAKRVPFRTSDTCIDINCSFRIPTSFIQYTRFSFGRKVLLGLILGILLAIIAEALIFIISGALQADRANEPEEEYFDFYDSPGFHDYIAPDLPLGLSRDPIESSALNDTSPDDRTPRNTSFNVNHTEDEGFLNEVRVLCWVLTSPKTHRTRAIHVKRTWGKRCNILLFMSSKNDSMLESVSLNITEGRKNLSLKTREAFQYIYKHYRDQADFFLKADDDTYVVVDNLRKFLSSQDPEEPVYFGCRFKPYVQQGYMSGGSGYVLSKAALEYLVKYGINRGIWPCKRTSKNGIEDVEMGRCLEAVGVYAGDSRDPQGSHRFLPFNIDRHVNAYAIPLRSWYFRYMYYPQPMGLSCCSDSAIAFHYIKPDGMYSMNYMLYHFRVMVDR